MQRRVGSLATTAGSVLAGLAVISLLAATAGASGRATPQRGGVYRVGWEKSFGFTDGFDPTGEYLAYSFDIFSNLMVRTLVGYDHVPGAAGNRLVPDLATSVPRPTNGGRTYTFHLKPGTRFGPPVDRAVTSHDVAFAFERLANPKDGGEYPFYYTVIKGWNAYAAGKARTIAGIQTPSDSVIVFQLNAATGDFLDRVAMPATGPIPDEVAGCFNGADASKYGRDVVSTGPYMIAGMDKVDASTCSTLKPASGFDGQTTLTLVRNPAYDPKTDSPAARQNLPDEFQFTVVSSLPDILDKVAAGSLDDEIPEVTPQALQHYATTPGLKPYLHRFPNDSTYYLTMNLTQPPFDDIHVRRALNWVMNKAGLIQAGGGPLTGAIAHHIVPDTIFDEQLVGFDPYGTPGEQGSLAKAKAAMKGSPYDTKGDGTCSSPQCKNVVLLADANEIDSKRIPVIEASAAEIGITFKVRTVAGAFPTLQTPKNNVPAAEFPAWGKDFADPSTFFDPLFAGTSIITTGNTNFSLVGITPAIAKKVRASGNTAHVANIDAKLQACQPLAGQARLTCYESVDKYLMTEVVPWVPYRWSYDEHITSTNVTQWEFDQFGDSTAFAHVAVKQ